MRNIFLATFFCVLFFTSSSQQLYFNHLSVSNGLSQGVNNCIFRDSRGFVWISSFDGLNRFDGTDCRRYYASPVNPGGLKGTLFLNITEDQQHNIWIGSNEGLNCYFRNSDSFTCYKPDPNSNTDQFCSPFYIDQLGHVWVQSGADIYVFDPASKTFRLLGEKQSGSGVLIKTWPKAMYQPVQQLVVVSNATATLKVGAVRSNNVHWKEFALPLSLQPVNALLIADTNCWLATSNGMYSFDLREPVPQYKQLNQTAGNNITSIHFDKTGAIWFGTFNNGLYKTDTTGSVLQQFNYRPDNSYSISGNRISYITTDADNALWISVWGKGVDYTSLSRFHFNRYISREEAAEAGTDNFIRSMISVNNEIWCATQSGGIIILDEQRRIKQVIRAGLPSSLEHLYAAGNTVWVASFDGLYTVDVQTRAISRPKIISAISLPLAALQYNYVCELPDGNLLLSSNAGIYTGSASGNAIKIAALKGVSASDVYLTSYVNAKGDIFLSKAFKGFAVYRLEGDSLISKAAFPLHATIKCFTPFGDSLLWLGTTVGLVKFNALKQTVSRIFTTADGLSNHYVYGVVPAGNELWLSTNSGLNRFNIQTGAVKLFSTANGLQSNEYNTYAFCQTSSGEILFGGVNGLNSFYPSQLQPFKTAPQLVLSSVQVNDSLYRSVINYEELRTLHVSYDKNTVGFQFTVIDFVNAGAAHILYMLDGYDKGWVKAANKSFIRYVKLPPGNYTLKVKGYNADGVETAAVYELLVIIDPPWWQLWWFRLLVLVVMAALVTAAIRNYLNAKLRKQRIQLEKELAVEQERIRMAGELHDGLGSMLSGIKHSFSALKNEVQLNNDQQQRFDFGIDKLNESIRDIRAVSHTMFSAELLEEGLDAALKNYCASVSITSGIDIRFECIAAAPLHIGKEQAFQLFRVVQELVQNIVRHSQARQAIVQLSAAEKLLALTVEDDGKGFDLHQVHQSTGIGLRNTEARIKAMHGKTDIRSAAGKGTSVFIEVPVG